MTYRQTVSLLSAQVRLDQIIKASTPHEVANLIHDKLPGHFATRIKQKPELASVASVAWILSERQAGAGGEQWGKGFSRMMWTKQLVLACLLPICVASEDPCKDPLPQIHICTMRSHRVTAGVWVMPFLSIKACHYIPRLQIPSSPFLKRGCSNLLCLSGSQIPRKGDPTGSSDWDDVVVPSNLIIMSIDRELPCKGSFFLLLF